MTVLGMAAAAMVWLIPGIAAARWLRLIPTGDRALDAALAVMGAAVVSMITALAAWLLGFPADQFDRLLVLVAVLSLLTFGKRIRSEPEDPPAALTSVVVWLTVLGLAALGYLTGGSMRFGGDGPDHVGTIREILASGQFFPTEAFHLDAGILGADARKGLLHPVLAALAHLVRLDPVDFWLRLPGLTAPASFLAAYGLLRLLGCRAGWAAAGAWVFLLSWSGGIAREFLRLSGYPNQFGAALFWLAAGAGIRTLTHPGTKWAVAAGLGAFAAIAVHPMYAVFTAWFGLLALAYVLVGARRDRGVWLRLAVVTACVAPLAGLYLVARLPAYAPANPLHTELQGMLLLTDTLFVADPLLLFSHVGWVGPAAYLAVILVFLKRRRRDPTAFFVFWATVTMLLVTLNPWLVPFLQRHLTYLVFRSFWFLPAGLAAILVLREAWTLRARGRIPVVALLALGMLPAILATARVDRWPGAPENPRFDSLRWREAFETIGAGLPARSVIAADPVTSYLIPAYTPLKVVCTLDQHATPNDSLCVDRLTDARDILSPAVSPGEAWRKTRARGASHVLIHSGFSEPLATAYWAYSTSDARRRAAQFASSPGFRERPAPDGFRLFELGKSAPPAVRWSADRWYEAPPDTALVQDGLALIHAEAALDSVAAGGTVEVHLAWAGLPGADPRQRSVFVRFDNLGNPDRGKPLGKLWRKWRERREGVLYRFRYDTLPGGAAAAPERFTAGMAQLDTVRVTVPEVAAEGSWAISVQVASLPIMPNYRLRDYVSDRDMYSGTAVDTIRITR